MYIDEIRDYGLSLPHVTERQPYGPDCLVLEIGGKQFCVLDLTGKWRFFNLKVNPEYSLELQARFMSVRPGFHMNKKHWVSVEFTGDVPDSLQRELIVHAYRQTAKGLTKKMRITLGIGDAGLKER